MGLHPGEVPSQPSGASRDPNAIRKRKAEVRREARRARQQLSDSLRRWKDERITEAALACDALTKASTVCLYWSLPEEVGTRDLIRRCLARGQRLALPCHSKEKALRLVSDPERQLVSGESPGVLEPGPECPLVAPESIEAFVLPGVAFDIYGHRIGFGGGYFDEVLARRDPHSLAAALAYDCQMFREVPFAPEHDRPVEQVFTEEKVYAFQRSERLTADAEATGELAHSLATRVSPAFRLGLVGPLGVGKTTFIRGILKALGVRQAVTSPSFVLMNEYPGPLPVRHIDLYRLGDRHPGEEDLQMFLETLYEFPGAVLIEWANIAHEWLPLWLPQVFIEFHGGDERRMILETYRPEDRSFHECFL